MSGISSAGYRGRFAPSPTGGLHLGLARTALLGYLRARSQGGAFVLRIEDIDTPRVLPGAAEALLEELRFLGIEWDEGPDRGGAHGPYVQSQRSARYEAAIEQLRQAGLVYPCTCSRKEIALASAPHGPAEFGAVYPGTCRERPSRPDSPGSLRFRTPEQLPRFVDACSGELVAPLAQGDFVLRRADGMFSYQLAVVVDDIAMGISEVLRGDDLAGCTGWQLALYDALGAPRPGFAHVPLLLGEGGRRLAKRDAAASIAELRAQGKQADEIVGTLAASVNLVPAGTRVLPSALIADFSLARVCAQKRALIPS
jgi:glutamyl-tRNA synthetase